MIRTEWLRQQRSEQAYVSKPNPPSEFQMWLAGSNGRVVSAYGAAARPNRNADRKQVFILRADGSVLSRPYLNRTPWADAKFDRQIIYKGDTIVVPEQLNETALLRGLTGWSRVFSQFALAWQPAQVAVWNQQRRFGRPAHQRAMLQHSSKGHVATFIGRTCGGIRTGEMTRSAGFLLALQLFSIRTDIRVRQIFSTQDAC
jgi:hypothetical protein